MPARGLPKPPPPPPPRRESAELTGTYTCLPLFLFIFHILYIHTIIQSHSYNSFAESSLQLLITCQLSGTELPVVPSRESNSGLPSSKSTRYQLSHAAPNQLSHAAPNQLSHAAPIPTEPRRTNTNWATPHQQLSHAAPQLSHAAPQLSHAAPQLSHAAPQLPRRTPISC